MNFMKYRKNITISLALVFLLLLVPSFGLVVAQAGWNQIDYAPTRTFEHYWTGTLLHNESGIETWELYAENRMMVPMDGTMGCDVEWVKMTIVWDPSAHNGQITKFEHHGCNLMFSGGTGTIEESNSYSFNVSIEGTGKYRVNGAWYDLVINGSYIGVYDADNELIPLLSGNSTCGERATLRYYVPPVGGEVIPVNNMAVLSPYLALVVLAAAVSVTAAFVIKRRPFY